jgi:hypothetical protein
LGFCPVAAHGKCAGYGRFAESLKEFTIVEEFTLLI